MKDFISLIYSYYRDNERIFSFRNTKDPYKIVVSEVMLQQTQTARVEPKYDAFIRRFPTVEALAAAELAEVLTFWKGLGYNRRAKFLRDSAVIIRDEYHGRVPDSPDMLVRLPGIGPATAASIAAFAFNKPTVFLEVNIRRVFIHFFFPGRTDVADRELYPLVEQSLDRIKPREWYYALMDYGAMLKKEFPELGKFSTTYVKQKPFQGSNRQIRGRVVGYAAEKKRFSLKELGGAVECAEPSLKIAVTQLEQEGFLLKNGDIYIIAD